MAQNLETVNLFLMVTKEVINMRIQQVQPNTTFNANKTIRRLDYESHELLEKLLGIIDKETVIKSNEYAYE